MTGDTTLPVSAQQAVIAINRLVSSIDDQTTALSAAVAGVAAKLVLETAQASTSGSTIDFVDIPTWVKKVTCLFSGTSLNGTDHLLVQIGDSGGIETSGYVSTSTILTAASAVAATNSTAGFVIYDGAAANTVSGALVIYNITGDAWVANGVFNFDSGTTINVTASGSKTLSATLDRVRFTVTGANAFDAGTVNIVYE